jgi:hypothetical protein
MSYTRCIKTSRINNMRKDHYVRKLYRRRARLLKDVAGPDKEKVRDRVDQIEEEIKEHTGRKPSHTWLYSSGVK